MIQINNKILVEMRKLYIEGLSIEKIAKKFNLANSSTRNYLLKAGAKFKTASKDVVSISQHNKFINLYQEGKSIKRIAQICNVSFSTVRRHLIKSNLNLKKRGNPTLIKNRDYEDLTSEKAYVLGVIGPGDGFMEYRKKEGLYRVALEAVDLDFVKYFSLCLEKVYGIKPKIVVLKMREGDSKPHYKSILQSKKVCDDLLSCKADFKEKTWNVPEIIKNSSREIKAKYIQGFADSQGSVHTNYKQIILCNQNIGGLKEIEELLNDLKIKNISYDKRGIILCNRKNVELFGKLINFNISYKKEKLTHEIENYKNWKTTKKEMLKLKPRIIELRKKGLSYPRISKSLGISTNAAWIHAKDVIIVV